MCQKYCQCHEVAIILKSGQDKDRPCPGCGLPRKWFFSVVWGKGEFIAMMKREPFSCANPHPLTEPGDLWFEFGETEEQAFSKLRNELHALEKVSPFSKLIAFFKAEK